MYCSHAQTGLRYFRSSACVGARVTNSCTIYIIRTQQGCRYGNGVSSYSADQELLSLYITVSFDGIPVVTVTTIPTPRGVKKPGTPLHYIVLQSVWKGYQYTL